MPYGRGILLLPLHLALLPKDGRRSSHLLFLHHSLDTASCTGGVALTAPLPLPHGHGTPRACFRLMPPLAVTAQGITERLLQWPEPALEMLPLLETLAKDRLTYLLGARRADAARGAVVVQARRLEGQLAELEQAPDAALKIVDDVLVVNAQHPTREHRIPVLHELEVGAIVSRD